MLVMLERAAYLNHCIIFISPISILNDSNIFLLGYKISEIKALGLINRQESGSG